MDDPYDLKRFVDAQDPVYTKVLSELRKGVKESHWMWFIFPQLKGLGYSWMAEKYGISSLDEANAYLRHPILGARLRECAQLVNVVTRRSAVQIFGDLDNLKFGSCMTLFAHVAPDDEVFAEALRKYFGGVPDQLTLDSLRDSRGRQES